MSKHQPIIDSILKQGMVPLFFYEDAEVSLEITRALYRAGNRVLEYTNRGPEALENFKLFYEEVVFSKQITTRVRRSR